MADSYSSRLQSSDNYYECQASESNSYKPENVCDADESEEESARTSHILRMFQSSHSYWNNFIRASNWFIHHLDLGELTQRSSDCYEHYCQSQMVYHAQMANMFYKEWLNLQKQTTKVSSGRNRSPNCYPHDSAGHGFERTGSCTNAQRSKRPARSRKSSKRGRSRRNKKKMPGHAQCHIQVHLGDQSSNGKQLDLIFDGTDSAEFEMEITEDMLEFFTKSARHRKERDSKKQNPSGCDVFVEFSEVSSGKSKATTEPPKERPDQRRNEEMKELYGIGSAMVHGMETAMQLTFDRNLARQQPQLWPALPINFNCDSTKRMGIFNLIKTALL